jgi:hypothetical protein
MALGRGIAAAACAGTLSLVALGCGAEEHPNEPRPSAASRVSVAVTESSISVLPERVGVGPAKSQLIPQNQNQPQPPIHTKAPLNVVFVITNLTPIKSRLVIRGPKNTTSGPLVPHGNFTLHTDLPTGVYTVRATGLPHSGSDELVVGSYRASSQNDLLEP